MNSITEISYPYLADETRANLIRTQYKSIRIGDSEAIVLKKLPNPDEVRDAYEPIKYKPNIIGKT